MTARRKPVTVFAVVDELNWVKGLYLQKRKAEADCFYEDQGERVVKITEPSPLARYDAAVMRAVEKLVRKLTTTDSPDLYAEHCAVVNAVERREKARRAKQ